MQAAADSIKIKKRESRPFVIVMKLLKIPARCMLGNLTDSPGDVKRKKRIVFSFREIYVNLAERRRGSGARAQSKGKEQRGTEAQSKGKEQRGTEAQSKNFSDRINRIKKG